MSEQKRALYMSNSVKIR